MSSYQELILIKLIGVCKAKGFNILEYNSRGWGIKGVPDIAVVIDEFGKTFNLYYDMEENNWIVRGNYEGIK